MLQYLIEIILLKKRQRTGSIQMLENPESMLDYGEQDCKNVEKNLT